MPAISEQPHAVNFIRSEANGSRSRDNITIAKGAGILAPGTVLGRVSPTGFYVASSLSATDGSERAAAILMYEVDADKDNVRVAAITRDAEVNGLMLIYDGSVSSADKKAAKVAELADQGIIVR